MLALLADCDVLFILSLAFWTVDVTHRVYFATFRILTVKKNDHYYSSLLYIQQYIEFCQRIYTIYSVVAIHGFLKGRNQTFFGE